MIQKEENAEGTDDGKRNCASATEVDGTEENEIEEQQEITAASSDDMHIDPRLLNH